MKASDFIVEYLVEKGITDVFGYPGGMVTHLMDSLSKYSDSIRAHVTYHEQGAAFAACGYAQTSGKVGVAYATSGPGATNLITGICDAYFDSIPTLFITGQVNTFESKGQFPVRQRGFQETDIVSIVRPVTKYAAYVEDAQKLKWYLDYAFHIAQAGRKGPVVLDIPMNIFRTEINPKELPGYQCLSENDLYDETVRCADVLTQALSESKRPVLLIGQGVKLAGATELLRVFVEKTRIPVVTSMLAVDALNDPELNFGFIGAYGSRSANFVVAKSDLVISIGARLDVRQVGAKRENFAPNAKLIRIDIDEGELDYKVHENEVSINADAGACFAELNKRVDNFANCWTSWLEVCQEIKSQLQEMDNRKPNALVSKISSYIPDNVVITTDVGQNQVWVAQSLKRKKNQRIMFSGGHGAMGYSLPAAIGCAIASGKPVYSFNGDGGLQMNIQELQVLARENLPIKVIVFNNSALGMIRHFQEMYFEDNYSQTIPSGGYSVPDFGRIAAAYGIDYFLIDENEAVESYVFESDRPALIEVRINEKTYVFPKLEFGKPNQDQEPLLNRELFDYLMEL